MIESRKKMSVLIFFALFSVFSLYLYACSIEPELMQISDIDEKDIGRLVSVQGILIDISPGEEVTNLVVRDLETPAELILFLGSPSSDAPEWVGALVPGVTVEAQGIVAEYNGEMELMLSSWDSIQVIASPEDNHVPVHICLKVPYWYTGVELNTSGTVRDLDYGGSRAFFALEENEGSALFSMSCCANTNDVPEAYWLSEGDTISVLGQLSYDETTGHWTFNVRTVYVE